jgi:hypothetical protein
MMRIDLYTKVVLTGILGCLVWLCLALTPIGTPVQAQLAPTQVVLTGYQVGGVTKAVSEGLPVVVLSVSQGTTAAPPGGVAPAAAAPQPAAAGPPAATSSGRCQATTQRGTQCSRAAKAGSKYCWQHGS